MLVKICAQVSLLERVHLHIPCVKVKSPHVLVWSLACSRTAVFIQEKLCVVQHGENSPRCSGECCSVVQHPLMPQIVLVSGEIQIRLWLELFFSRNISEYVFLTQPL